MARVSVPPGQRRALATAVAAAGGWEAPKACRRALGPRPASRWTSTWQVARRLENEAGLDLAALDPGAPALRDTFCRQLELRRRCPGGRGAWLRALAIALGWGGRRSYAGLDREPGFQAYNAALVEATGEALPVPAATVLLDQYDQAFEECTQQHQDHVANLVARARRRKLAVKGSVPF